MPRIDVEKRRRVMQRSMSLGHCICDPRRPCPCDVFTNQGICPCAGERPEAVGESLPQIRLTDHVHNAGCASKVSPADLERVLRDLPEVIDPAIISGLPAGDDAGIYKLSDGTTIVQTVDVFTPCADDPETFGRICAANCLSDIYAMGGVPRTALSILAFPSETLDGRLMTAMLAGAMKVLSEANCSLLGGHSIKDEEIKLGFAITGTIDPAQATSLETARAGDVLVLTKPLGSGVLSFARQIGRADERHLRAAETWMATLNKAAAEAAAEVGVSACTDITGFGLLGHLVRMARHSGVSARLRADALPAYDGAMQALRAGIIPGATERNREFLGDSLQVGDGVEEALVNLALDAQTSGGLLLSVPRAKHAALVEALRKRNVLAATIGEIVSGPAGRIEMVYGEGKELMSDKTSANATPAAAPSSACCGGEVASTAAPVGNAVPGSSGESAKAFGAMMRSAAAGGAIDARTKELINFALVLQSRCGPCLGVHLAKARQLGITQEELDEVAWCAISMGGAPVKMFYEEGMKNNRG